MREAIKKYQNLRQSVWIKSKICCLLTINCCFVESDLKCWSRNNFLCFMFKSLSQISYFFTASLIIIRSQSPSKPSPSMQILIILTNIPRHWSLGRLMNLPNQATRSSPWCCPWLEPLWGCLSCPGPCQQWQSCESLVQTRRVGWRDSVQPGHNLS